MSKYIDSNGGDNSYVDDMEENSDDNDNADPLDDSNAVPIFDDGSEDGGESDVDETVAQQLEKPLPQHGQVIVLTTDGLPETHKKYLPKETAKNLFQCGYCMKWYDEYVSTPECIDDSNMLLCQHCFFWMNHDYTLRNTADVKYEAFGVSVANYIINCSKDHDSAKCTRADQCFLCEYNVGAVIENIGNLSLLYPDAKQTATNATNTVNTAMPKPKPKEDNIIIEIGDDICQKMYYVDGENPLTITI